MAGAAGAVGVESSDLIGVMEAAGGVPSVPSRVVFGSSSVGDSVHSSTLFSVLDSDSTDVVVVAAAPLAAVVSLVSCGSGVEWPSTVAATAALSTASPSVCPVGVPSRFGQLVAFVVLVTVEPAAAAVVVVVVAATHELVVLPALVVCAIGKGGLCRVITS